MASISTASSQSVVLSATDRLVRLVNNDQFADVTFRVGVHGELMFGHKAILAEASEVFRAQFAGAFRESRENLREQAIPIADIEPATFKELLRSMYSDKVSLTLDSVVDVYYGAVKYLLEGLKKTCLQFLAENLTECNVLQLFDQNRRYELEVINRACLNIICDNPIKLFADECFLAFSRKSVELITSQKLINCQATQLLAAIERWIKVNEDDSIEGARILSMAREQNSRDFKCQKMHNFSAGHYLNSTSTVNVTGYQRVLAPRTPSPRPRLPIRSVHTVTTVQIPPPVSADFVLQIGSDFPFSIYGFGICIKASRVLNPITLDISVVRTKNGVGQIGLPIIVKRTVTPNDKFCVEEIIVEKLTIARDITCTITVYADHGREQLFCFKTFEPEKQIVGLRFFSNYAFRDFCPSLPVTNSILSYVLYESSFGNVK